jgi:UPF0755 protein
MRTTKKSPWIILPLILLIVGIAAGTLLLSLAQPVNPQTQETQRFIIPKGQAVAAIADRLQEAGLVKNALVFRIIVKKENLGNQIQAGSFDLSPNMSAAEIARELTQGTNDLWITIPEGWRREEIAQSLAQQELPEFSEQQFLASTAGREGRLFPDTYLVSREATAEQIARLLEQTFERKVVTELADEIETSAYDFDDALVMASIIEREARGADELRIIAGILWNRVEIGMALNADATLQYIKGYSRTENSWWVPPLAADKQLNSAYNTYLHAGLPPQPISNPGVQAIEAALNPASTGYFYYLHDMTGQVHYAETLEQHNANVQTYLR